MVMKEDLYLEIIKKQQELINLMLKTEIGTDIKETPAFETELKNNAVIEIEQSQNNDSKCDISGFEKWLKRKGMSQNGIDSYLYTVKEFYKKYGVLNNDNLEKYENYLKENWKPKTVNLRIAGMTKYFKYINYTEYEFLRLKDQKQTFCDNAINEEQYTELMSWAKLNMPKVWMICRVMASTGVRVSELIELKTADLEKGYADIVGKGNKQRRIYYTKSLQEEIKEQCGVVYIVENRYGLKMSTRGVSQLLVTASERSGIPREVMHPHSFRHYFAKQFMKQTQDISLLGDILGHSNISTTAIYTRMTSQEQKDEIERLVNW